MAQRGRYNRAKYNVTAFNEAAPVYAGTGTAVGPVPVVHAVGVFAYVSAASGAAVGPSPVAAAVGHSAPVQLYSSPVSLTVTRVPRAELLAARTRVLLTAQRASRPTVTLTRAQTRADLEATRGY